MYKLACRAVLVVLMSAVGLMVLVNIAPCSAVVVLRVFVCLMFPRMSRM